MDTDGYVWTVSNRGSGIGCQLPGGELVFRSTRTFSSIKEGPIGLVGDSHGGVWLSTKSNGVAYLLREELVAALRDHELQPEFTWFDKRHGLGSKHGPFWPNGIVRARDGRIWVATAAGASVTDPVMWKRYRAGSTPPRVIIENCAADGAALNLESRNGSALRLPVGTDWLNIDFNAFDYGKPGEATFRYRLRGLSDSWVDAGAETTANLNQLPPGEYAFEVVAANRFGQWSESPAVLEISIPPQWWQTSWFRVTSLLSLALLAISVYLLRVHRLKRVQLRHYEVSRRLIHAQETERQRIAAELHDGLGQNLTVVKNRLTASAEEQVSDADIHAAATLVSDTIDDVRRMSHNLRPYGARPPRTHSRHRGDGERNIGVQRSQDRLPARPDRRAAFSGERDQSLPCDPGEPHQRTQARGCLHGDSRGQVGESTGDCPSRGRWARIRTGPRGKS